MYNYIHNALKECHFALKQSGTSCGAQGTSDGTVVSRLFDKTPQARLWKAAIAAIRDFKEAVTTAVICVQQAALAAAKKWTASTLALCTPPDVFKRSAAGIAKLKIASYYHHKACKAHGYRGQLAVAGCAVEFVRLHS